MEPLPPPRGHSSWRLQDDTGQIHTLTLPETYYSENVEHRLLSPQHWAQVAKQGKGTKCTTYHDCIVLSWGKGQQQKTNYTTIQQQCRSYHCPSRYYIISPYMPTNCHKIPIAMLSFYYIMTCRVTSGL